MLKIKINLLILLFNFFITTNVIANSSQVVIRVALSENSPPTSFVENGESKGIIKDLLKLIFEQMPKYKLEFYAQPWNRAQYQVQNNALDLFVTYPSTGRKTYANFMEEPLYNWDYSYLIYSKDNLKSHVIENAKSFEDLKELIFLSHEGVDWEKENVPAFINRMYFNKVEGMIHSLFKRNSGDFIIMSDTQAIYFANKFGYQSKLGIRKVGMISNSNILFHIGMRKNFVGQKEILEEISVIMKSPQYLEKKKNFLRGTSI